MSFDAHQFKRLERAGYNRIGQRYLDASGPRGALADTLLATAQLAPGHYVLDLASGPGLLAAGASHVVGNSGLTIASDIAEGQLACCPQLTRVAADGEVLPFANASFDRVLCGLGLMMFPHVDQALGEMHRVLRPDGLAALSVWSVAADVPLIECALACMRRILPPPKVARPSIFRFGEPGELERRLASAEFRDITIETCKFSVVFADAPAYWQAFLDLAGGAAESLARLPEAKRTELSQQVAEELAPHAVSGGYRLVSQIKIATARR